MKDIIVLCFPVQTHYLGNCCFTVYRPKCSCQIRLQVIDFWHRDSDQENIACEDYCCWLGVAMHAQSHPNMPRLSRGELVEIITKIYYCWLVVARCAWPCPDLSQQHHSKK